MLARQIITLKKLTHNNRNYVAINFNFSVTTKDTVLAFDQVKWSEKHQCFYVVFNKKIVNTLFIHLRKNDYYVDYSDLKSTPNKAYLEPKKIKPKADMSAMFKALPLQYKELLRNYTGFLRGKRLSQSTIKSYGYFVLRFLDFINPKAIEMVQKRDFDSFFEVVLARENYSISSHRQSVSGLKYLIEFCQLPEIKTDDIKRPKKSKTLPTVLSKEEIIDVIRVTKNLKHRAIIGLIYSCGLRIGELINLRINAIDFDRNMLKIDQSKGRKDRNIMMSNVLKPLLLNYLNTYRPKQFIIEGRDGGKYSAGSIRQFLTKSCKLVGITKRVTPHVLRHSYATHLIENGVGLRHIQILLGHSKPETTMIYTHVAHKDLMQIKNPLDTVVESITKSEKNPQKVLLSQNYVP